MTEKTSFKGRVFMTHATKAIGLLLIKDYIRVRCGDVGHVLPIRNRRH